MMPLIRAFLLLENETLLRVFRAKEIKITHVELILIESQANSIHTDSHPYGCFSNGQI